MTTLWAAVSAIVLGVLRWGAGKIADKILRRRSAEEEVRDLKREIQNVKDEREAKKRMRAAPRSDRRDASERLRDPDRRI